ncbi:MAG: amino acid adenylation domain-containing protein, partial [Peptococcaceae bacterium]|nr:amino acid adenylation domain-containing protein [Peptococcaceae bacterium]
LEFRDFSYSQGDNDYINWFNNFSKQAFPLYDSKLYKFVLIKLNNSQGGFIFKCHHLISDAWSYILTLNKILETYNSMCEGSLVEPLEKTVNKSYQQHILKEQNYFTSERFAKDRAYWQKTLEQATETNLYDNGNRNGFKAIRKQFTLPPQLYGRIMDFCKEHEVTPFILFASLLAIFYWKTKEKSTVTLGATVLNRSSIKDKNTIGAFFNDLPFILKLTPGKKYKDFLHDLSLNWLELLRHSNYPYVNILKDYREKHKVKSKVFDVLLTYVTAAYAPQMYNSKVETERHFANEEVNSLCIAIDNIEGQGTYNICYDYAEGLLNEEDIQLLHQSILNLLEDAMRNPYQEIQSLNLLSSGDEQKILYDFNRREFIYRTEESLVPMFLQQVDKKPDKKALIFDDQVLTYRELDQKSNQLARALLKRGLKAGEIVGLAAERSLEMVIGILGVLKAGAAYLPIDPGFPRDRVNYMLENSNCSCLLTNCEISLGNTDSRLKIIHLEDEQLWQESTARISSLPKSKDLAYVIYTSGSTGLPKGVMIEHHALCSFVEAVTKEIDMRDKTIVSLTTLSFDIFFLETVLPLLIGMTVVIAGPEEKHNPAVLPALISKYNVEVLQVTPSKMSVILNNPAFLNRLSLILIGGEAFPETLLPKLKSLTKAQIYNMYGPTEATIWSSCRRLDNIDDNDKITIGKPFVNTKYYILDKYLKPLPIGITGEIHIAGDCLARGYLNRPELTAEKFISNPFLPGTKMYKTGDLGRWLENGEIECLGRNDNQVKIRGFRIETGEIEKYLLQNDLIKQAVVTALDHENGKKFLCAYLEGSELPTSELRSYLERFLPDYMIPSRFIWLEKMPLTPNGKIDRKALPQQVSVLDSERKSYTPPRNNIERRLQEIWIEVLGQQNMGIDDDFFASGGDSLDVLEILTALISYGWQVSAQDFYEYPTIRKLAQLITTRNPNKRLSSKSITEYPAKIPNFDEQLDINCQEGILLTGATGFLGIHILKELCDKVSGKIYCLVRGNQPRQKLAHKLKFYFPELSLTSILQRVIIVKGDITDHNLGLSPEDYQIVSQNTKLVIHCASLVKHLGNYAEFEKINVQGTENVISFCSRNHAHLSYISTMSVSGNYMFEGLEKRTFSEEDLFIEQDLSVSVYIKSKFEAECLIQKARNSGLKATVFRVGLLTGRFSDGKFQYNIEENAYYRRLRSIFALKCLPENTFGELIELTPVDLCAQALITILNSPEKKQPVYHLFNHNFIRIKDFMAVVKSFGLEVNSISANEFMALVSSLSKTAEEKEILSGIINDLMYNGLSFESVIEVKSDTSTAYLKNNNFVWPPITREYVSKIISYMESADFLINLQIKDR